MMMPLLCTPLLFNSELQYFIFLLLLCDVRCAMCDVLLGVGCWVFAFARLNTGAIYRVLNQSTIVGSGNHIKKSRYHARYEYKISSTKSFCDTYNIYRLYRYPKGKRTNFSHGVYNALQKEFFNNLLLIIANACVVARIVEQHLLQQRYQD